MTFEKRASILRALFNDYIPCPYMGKLSVMEVWGMIAVPVVIALVVIG